jgi:hypothetical protein
MHMRQAEVTQHSLLVKRRRSAPLTQSILANQCPEHALHDAVVFEGCRFPASLQQLCPAR